MTAYAYAKHDANRNPADPFEWEELPSMSHVVLRRHLPTGSYTLAAELVAQARERRRSEPPSAPVWVETKAADLDPLQPSGPLCETELGGLAAREIIEPDVFRHFFGAAQQR
ncbi:MAG: hypothetical protein V4792_03365 [Pseudomonadota bacterium]